MKDDNEVIKEFNEYVNVSASELDKWLKSDDSSKAGWHKDGGDGESVGQDSGHKIVEILKSNPGKDPKKYTDDQIQHMRKVASYCKRHLAQESKSLKEKDPEEAKKTKSYISLMNWGHDPLRALGKGSKSSSKKQENEGEEEEEEQGQEQEQEDNGEEAEEDDKKAGDKRKKPAQQSGASKKRETRQGGSSKKDNGGDEEEQEDQEEHGEGEPEAEDDGDYEEGDDNEDSGGKSSGKGPSKGDTVSWKWGSGHPEGKVLDVKEDDATITTKRGNEVSRKGKPDDPAVILDAGKSKAIKLAHELD